MMRNKTLKHLDKSLPEKAKGYMMSGYSIALEGWRRGLELSMKVIYSKSTNIRVPVFTLSNGKLSYTFHYTRANVMEKESIRICINKNKTKKLLSNSGIVVPKGQLFKEDASVQQM